MYALLKADVFPAYQKKMFFPWFPYVYAGFAIVWTFIVLITTFGGYWHGRDMLLSRKTDYVEGIVTDFVPMPHTGHAMEHFTVHGVQFSYSDFVVVPGFHQTSSYNGPIREGLPVKIWAMTS